MRSFLLQRRKMTEKETHLKHKQDELNSILEETEKEENLLHDKSDEYSKLIDERLLKAYKKIRSNVRNGLAVVTIERGASGGSFLHNTTTTSGRDRYKKKDHY